jgi:peptidoglycan/xylan/chitin deacetylase (PgdA/CDA1 family)
MLPWKYPGFLTRILLPEAIFHGDASGNRIYLTFDDGPDPEVTPTLLDFLAKRKAKTTFFVVANENSWWPELLREMGGQGHLIGLHGLKHSSKYAISNQKLWEELTVLMEKISEAGVEPQRMYRPPFGHIRPDTVKFLKNKGISTILWSQIPGDWRQMNIEKLYQRATNRLRPGDIMALHDGSGLRPAPVLELTSRLLDLFDAREWNCETLADLVVTI